jgi:hypothetical protein
MSSLIMEKSILIDGLLVFMQYEGCMNMIHLLDESNAWAI